MYWPWAMSCVLGCVLRTGLYPVYWAVSCVLALGYVLCTGLYPVHWAVSYVLGCILCTGLCPMHWAVSYILGCVLCVIGSKVHGNSDMPHPYSTCMSVTQGQDFIKHWIFQLSYM